MSHEEKAIDLIQKAEKKLKGFALFGNKKEEACEMYQQAANLFKIAKNWQAAGDAFVRVAELHISAQSKHDAASAYTDAANCFKKCNVDQAVMCLKFAAESSTENGRFSTAAKQHKEIGELYEGESNFAKAIEHYQLAGEYYSGEEATSSANQCYLKLADLSAQTENYAKAIETYEKVASAALEVALLKWSVKDYFFKAGLCHLVLDMVGAKTALDKYMDMDVSFADSRECKLLQAVLDAAAEGDVEAFTNVVFEFDTVTKLDGWKTSMLLKIKNQMKEQDFT